jgi:hypothetical protein
MRTRPVRRYTSSLPSLFPWLGLPRLSRRSRRVAQAPVLLVIRQAFASYVLVIVHGIVCCMQPENRRPPGTVPVIGTVWQPPSRRLWPPRQSHRRPRHGTSDSWPGPSPDAAAATDVTRTRLRRPPANSMIMITLRWPCGTVTVLLRSQAAHWHAAAAWPGPVLRGPYY